MRTASLVVALAIGLFIEAQPGVASEIVCSGNRCDAFIDWTNLPKDNTIREAAKTRITSAQSVVVHVTHFNFLRYGLEVSVKEKTIESYVYLNKLWQAVLLLPVGEVRTLLGTVDPLVAWREALRAANGAVDEALAKYPNVTLTDADIATIDADALRLKDGIATIGVKRDNALATLHEGVPLERIQYFNTIDQEHTAILERINAFVNTSELLHKEWTKAIDKRDAGRVVTATLTPKNKANGADGTPVTIEYFVNSTLPVYYHVGPVYNTVRDVRFEQVRSLAGNDLFAKIRDSSGTTSLAAFLSYPLRGRVSANWVPALTIGTDFSKPGDHLYLGLSFPYARFVGSVGVISASQNEAGNPVLDQAAGSSTNTRVLYDAFRTRHVWKPAFALTFKPFER